MKRADAAAVDSATEATENGTAETITGHTDGPAIQELPVTLSTGSIVMLDGTILPEAMRFNVDLVSGTTKSPDIAFHLNPRVQQKVVVRNSRIRGHWGTEELGALERFPFIRGETFTLQLLCAEEEFMVAINGKHFCSFTYRVPVAHIRLLQVTGHVSMQRMDCEKCDIYPIIPESEIQKYIFTLSETTPLSNFSNGTVLPTPVAFQLPNKFCEGKTVQINGRVKLLPFLFYINLQQGTQTWPHPDIPLHVNPRFGEKGPIIVCNSWLSGKWGLEERDVMYGLRASKEFTLQITCETDSYVILLNGISVCKFMHRISPKIVDCILVYGDVWVNEVLLQ